MIPICIMAQFANKFDTKRKPAKRFKPSTANA